MQEIDKSYQITRIHLPTQPTLGSKSKPRNTIEWMTAHGVAIEGANKYFTTIWWVKKCDYNQGWHKGWNQFWLVTHNHITQSSRCTHLSFLPLMICPGNIMLSFLLGPLLCLCFMEKICSRCAPIHASFYAKLIRIRHT